MIKIFTTRFYTILKKSVKLVFTNSIKYCSLDTQIATLTSKIINNISKKIQYQQDNSPQIMQQDSDINKLGWTIQRNEVLNQLKNQIGQNKVHVVFFSQLPIPQTQLQKSNKKSIQQSDYITNNVEFTMYIKSPKSEKVLYGDFVITAGDLTLLSVNLTNDYINHRCFKKFIRQRSIYNGRNLCAVSSGLIDQFYRYFYENGLSSQLISYIQQNSYDSEHSLYLRWLKSMISYIS